MNDADLPPGWQVWSTQSDGPVVLAYRPDVFDGSSFPPACLPTVYVSQVRDPRRGPRARSTQPWQAELRLEPDVLAAERTVPDRQQATTAAIELATAFADGELEYRAAYQDPHEAYLDALDRLIRGEDPVVEDETFEREA